MLRRKPHTRYLLILSKGKDVCALEALSKRCGELFGQVTLAKANLQVMRSQADADVMIIRCNLTQIHPVLVSIALTDPPMVALDMSGSIRRLENRLHSFPSVL